MLQLDLHTAYFLTGILYLILPILTLFALSKELSQQVFLWSIGGLLFGLSLVTFSQVGNLPNWVTLNLVHIIVVIAHIMRIQSLKLLLNKSLNKKFTIAFILLFITILQHIYQDNFLRAAFIMSINALLLGFLSFTAWQIAKDKNSINAKLISGVYLLVTIAVLYRLVMILSTPEFGSIFFALTPAVIALILSVTIGHMAYLGLALERNYHRRLETATQLAREEERYQLNNQIAHLDRQRTLGHMSAALAHEVNQPLTAILTNTQVAQRAIKMGRFNEEKIIVSLEKIEHNTQRASKIIENIRSFIRPAVLQKKIVINMNHIIKDVIELVAHDIRKQHINIHHTTPCDAWITGDAIQLSQVILNILRNAIDSVTQTNTHHIQMNCSSIDNMLCLRIQDSGTGFTNDALLQAGTPFFTTKQSGLGMGLSISQNIIEQHGGQLTVGNWHNQEGSGGYTEIYLPQLQQDHST